MKVRICENCGKHNTIETWNCVQCGSTLSVDSIKEIIEEANSQENPKQIPNTITCPCCGNVNVFSADECIKCGYNLFLIRDTISAHLERHTPPEPPSTEHEKMETGYYDTPPPVSKDVKTTSYYSQPPPVGQTVRTTHTNNLAIASIIIGALSLFVFHLLASVVAIYLAIKARKQVKEEGGAQESDVTALIGLILGSIGLFIGLVSLLCEELINSAINDILRASNTPVCWLVTIVPQLLD